MATLSPQAFPLKGLRKLTPKELMQRAKALNRTLEKKGIPSCSGQINVGIFFDGTGNSLDADYKKAKPADRKHSNVVKLFNTYPSQEGDGYFKHYIPGVGTPFPEIGDSGPFMGGAFGWNGRSGGVRNGSLQARRPEESNCRAWCGKNCRREIERLKTLPL